MLLVGVVGKLSYEITKSILEKQNIELRILFSPEDRLFPWGNRLFEQFSSRDILFVEGRLSDRSSLMNACEGVDIVVSAVIGNKQNILTGQLNLIEAAVAQGVRRMIPSDYSIDYRKLNSGTHYSLDIRKKIYSALKGSRLNYTLILSGMAMESLFTPFLNIFDFNAGTFNYWGDGETLFATTTIEDTARYVAEAALDVEMSNVALRVAGSVLSMKELLTNYERITGNTLTQRWLGSVADLRAETEKLKAHASSPNDFLTEQYLLAMVSGKGKFNTIQNSRYPDIVPTTVSQYIRNTWLRRGFKIN